MRWEDREKFENSPTAEQPLTNSLDEGHGRGGSLKSWIVGLLPIRFCVESSRKQRVKNAENIHRTAGWLKGKVKLYDLPTSVWQGKCCKRKRFVDFLLEVHTITHIKSLEISTGRVWMSVTIQFAWDGSAQLRRWLPKSNKGGRKNNLATNIPIIGQARTAVLNVYQWKSIAIIRKR